MKQMRNYPQALYKWEIFVTYESNEPRYVCSDGSVTWATGIQLVRSFYLRGESLNVYIQIKH